MKDIFPAELISFTFEISLIKKKNHLNSVLLCKLRKTLPDSHTSCLILTFAMKLEGANYKTH